MGVPELLEPCPVFFDGGRANHEGLELRSAIEKHCEHPNCVEASPTMERPKRASTTGHMSRFMVPKEALEHSSDEETLLPQDAKRSEEQVEPSPRRLVRPQGCQELSLDQRLEHGSSKFELDLPNVEAVVATPIDLDAEPRRATEDAEPSKPPELKIEKSVDLADVVDFKHDIFLSHLQVNAQNTVIAMNLFLRNAAPALKTFIDLEVNMNRNGGLQMALHDGVRRSRALLFFITDGIFKSEWCVQELRWARQMGRIIILVNETDPRHGGIDMKKAIAQAPADLKDVLRDKIAIPWYRQPEFRDVSVQRILETAEVQQHKDHTWAKRAEDVSTDLSSLMEGSQAHDKRVTATELICQNSLAMRVVFFFGGLYEFQNTGVDAMYVSLFNLSFWFCGGLCTPRPRVERPAALSMCHTRTRACHTRGPESTPHTGSPQRLPPTPRAYRTRTRACHRTAALPHHVVRASPLLSARLAPGQA